MRFANFCLSGRTTYHQRARRTDAEPINLFDYWLCLFFRKAKDMMNHHNLDFSLVATSSSLMERQATDKILACNEEIEKYGLVLTEQQALALVQTRTNALKENKRIELNGGLVDKLILAFCDSPYIEKDIYEDILHDLINLFYDLKNNTWDTISDDDVIEFMKNAFNNRCHGSLELLSGEALRLSEHIHCGKTIKTFKED